MGAITLVAKVVAYGFPALCLILGFSAWTGGTLAETFLGASNSTAIIGLLLMVIGIVIYVVELFIAR